MVSFSEGKVTLIMKSKYVLSQAATQSTSSDDESSLKDEKAHWLWALLLIILIALLIGLIILGFYNLPGTSGMESMTEYYKTSRNRSQTNQSATIPSLFQNLREICNKFANFYNIEFNVASGSEFRLAQNSTERTSQIGDKEILIKIASKNLIQNSSTLIFINLNEKSSGYLSELKNAIATIREIIEEMLKTAKTLSRSVVFLLTVSEEVSQQLVLRNFKHGTKNESDIKTIIHLDFVNGGLDMIIETRCNNRKLLEDYYKLTKHSHVCLLCQQVEAYIQGPQQIHPNQAEIKLTCIYSNQYQEIDNQQNQRKKRISQGLAEFIRSVANAEQIDEDVSSVSIVESLFFNFFDLFMFVYNMSTGIIINTVLSVTGFTIMALTLWIMKNHSCVSWKEIFFELLITFLIQLLTIGIGLGIVVAMAFLFDSYKEFVTWVPRPWLIFGIYFCPFIFILAIGPTLFLGWKKYKPLSIRFRIILFLHTNCIMFVLAIIAVTGMSVQTAFVIVAGIAFYILALIVNLIFRLHTRLYAWIFPILISQILPIAFFAYLLMIFYSVYIPVSAALGAPWNIELLIAFSAVGFSFLMFDFIVPFFALFHKSKTILCGFPIVMIIFYILIFTNSFFV